MENKSMESILEDSFEYSHKKFHHSKRLRLDSSGSSSGIGLGDESECSSIKFEVESFCASSPYNESNLDLNLTTLESSLKRTFASVSKEDTPLSSRAKRPRLNSFCSSVDRNAAVVPCTADIIPKISDETLRSICKYHGNMVRKFPKKERTPKDQERRNKNTIACRMSRRVKKLEHIAIEEQYKEFSQQTYDIFEKTVRASVYLHELMKFTSCGPPLAEVKVESSKVVGEKTTTTRAVYQKKPFTIAYLAGTE